MDLVPLENKLTSKYAKFGVDITKEERIVRAITKWTSKTFQFRKGKVGEVINQSGSFANLIDLGDVAIAFCTDGVGSKVLIAQELEKYETIGIDCVAMNVNDLICVGAEPISMVDYLALETPNEKIAKNISKGLYEGAKISQIAIVGGETASLPDIVTGIKGRGFDIAAAVIGIAKKEDIITGENIKPGDVILGFKSSGIHSNGLSLARNVLPRNMWMNLLTPTRIYVNEILELTEKFKIHGMANITGGGFLNLARLSDHGYLLDSLPEPHMIFKKIQELGKITNEEMHKTFNMGIGFAVIVDKSNAEDIIKTYGRKWKLSIIGKVVNGGHVTIKRKTEYKLK